MMERKRPHYYFKVAADSGVGKELHEFVGRCNEAIEKARQWVERQGAETFYESPDGFAGGVAFVEFKATICKDGWTNIKEPTKDGWQSTTFFVPNEGSDLEKEMLALPVVSESELIAILSFKPKTVKDKDDKETTLPFTFGDQAPALFLHHGYYYTDIPYESQSEDCERIDEKEFLRRRMAALNEGQGLG